MEQCSFIVVGNIIDGEPIEHEEWDYLPCKSNGWYSYLVVAFRRVPSVFFKLIKACSAGFIRAELVRFTSLFTALKLSFSAPPYHETWKILCETNGGMLIQADNPFDILLLADAHNRVAAMRAWEAHNFGKPEIDLMYILQRETYKTACEVFRPKKDAGVIFAPKWQIVPTTTGEMMMSDHPLFMLAILWTANKMPVNISGPEIKATDEFVKRLEHEGWRFLHSDEIIDIKSDLIERAFIPTIVAFAKGETPANMLIKDSRVIAVVKPGESKAPNKPNDWRIQSPGQR